MYHKRSYIDLHSDTITKLHYPEETLNCNQRMVSLDAMRQGGTWLQCFSAFVPTGHYPEKQREKLSWEQFCRIADKKDALLELHGDALSPVLCHQDLDAAPANTDSSIKVLFTLEDSGVFGRDLSKVKQAYDRGIRIATLIWNHENTLAFPNSSDSHIMNAGLKPFGFEVIEEMERLGILVDVSHLSDGGFWDVAETSKRPFVATHSNSRTLAGHPRNLTDDMIRRIAESGGVIGLNFYPAFLKAPNTEHQSRIEDMVRHVLHIRNTGGMEVLAIGSDFDGIDGDLEIGTPAQMPLLFDALKKAGLNERELDAMCSDNVLRVLRQI